MRLQDFEINSIKSTANQIFGKGSKVVLFGSRVYGNVKGGDIDLYIQPSDKNNLWEKKINFLVQLKSAIGDQKIDVIISRDKSRLIEQEAIKNGIEL
ncbi:MAG: nucleotidyltransferase domain-containing protein [Methylococcaceae bacterium]|nr:nucleotidyltransferase domain-containing protein [Methylococcaceae bacterium]